MPDVDPKSIAKSVGQASKRFAKTTKGVSKDLERAGDQAEKIGKILD
jgi:phosphate uptake regulator